MAASTAVEVQRPVSKQSLSGPNSASSSKSIAGTYASAIFSHCKNTRAKKDKTHEALNLSAKMTVQKSTYRIIYILFSLSRQGEWKMRHVLWPWSAGLVEAACTYGPPPSWSPPALCQGLLVPTVLSVKAASMCRTHSSSHPWLQSLIPSPQISSRWKLCLEKHIPKTKRPKSEWFNPINPNEEFSQLSNPGTKIIQNPLPSCQFSHSQR